MTSAKSLKRKSASSYDLKRSFTANLAFPCITLAFGVLIFAIMPSASFSTETPETVKNITEIYDMIFTYYLGQMGYIYMIIYTLLGALTALNAFKFINFKNQVNVYLSLGVSRKDLFKNRFIACLSMHTAAVIIPLLLNLILNINILGFKILYISYEFCAFLSIFTAVFIGFVIGAIASVLSGSFVDSSALAATLLLFPTMLLSSASTILEALLPNYYAPSINGSIPPNIPSFMVKLPGIFTRYSIFNPLYFSRPFGTLYLSEFLIEDKFNFPDKEFAAPSMNYYAPVLIWLIICVLGSFIAYKLFNERKAELAGMYGIKNRLNIFVASSFSLFISVLLLRVIHKAVLSIVLSAALFVLLSMLINFILSHDFKKTVNNLKYFAPSAAVLVAILLCVSFDAAGYSTKAPKIEKINAAYITVDVKDIVNNSQYRSSEDDTQMEIFCASNALGPFKTENDLKQLTDAVSKLAGKDKSENGKDVYVRYDMKNGSIRTIRYKGVEQKDIYTLLSLYSSEFCDERIDRIFDEKNLMSSVSNSYDLDYDEYNILHTNQSINSDSAALYSAMQNVSVPVGKIDGDLRAALVKDLKAQTWQELFCPEERAVAILSYNGKLYSNSRVIIYESMKNTVSYFEKSGLLKKLSALEEKPISAEVIPASEFGDAFINAKERSPQFIFNFTDDGSNEYWKGAVKYTDEKKIDSYAKAAVETYYNLNNDGHFVRFAFSDGSYTIKYIPSGK